MPCCARISSRRSKLTDDQQTELTDLSTRFRNRLHDLQQSGRESLEQKLPELNAERHKDVVAILTPKQQDTYGRLLGAAV